MFSQKLFEYLQNTFQKKIFELIFEYCLPTLFLNIYYFDIFEKNCFLLHAQRQETHLPYLTLLCDNLKKWMFLQNFFPDTILGICYVFLT
jgi:hypothetical protein